MDQGLGQADTSALFKLLDSLMDNGLRSADTCMAPAVKRCSGHHQLCRHKYTRDLTGVDVAIMGIPLTPLPQSTRCSLWTPGVRELASNCGRPFGWGFDPFKTLACVDYGDAPFDLVKPWDVPEEIETHARSVVEKGVTLLSIGGDHFVSYPVLKAHYDRYGPMALVHFDAHSDTWPSEPGDIEHGTMFYHAARDGIVVPEHSIQLGIRTHNSDRRGFEWVEGRICTRARQTRSPRKS